MRPSVVLGTVASLLLALACAGPPQSSAGPRWTSTGEMNEGRMWHTATVLPSGLVLAAGGIDRMGWTGDAGAIEALSSAELYDPAQGTWTMTGSMKDQRLDPSNAFLVPTGVHAGEVMKIGGCARDFETGDGSGWIYCQMLATTEFYVPATGTWEPGPRMLHAAGDAIQFADGKLLAIGSHDVGDRPPGPDVQLLDLSAPEPAWRLVSPMRFARWASSIVLLASGEVLVVGGLSDFSTQASSAAERYDPLNDRWRTAASLPEPRSGAVLIRLPRGNVLLAGGCTSAQSDCAYPAPPTTKAWIYEPDQDVWRPTSPMNYPHLWASAVMLDSGKVLLAGGNFKSYGESGINWYPSPTPEIFDPESETWSPTEPMPHYVMGSGGSGAMVKLSSGAVLFTGGSANGNPPENEFVAIPAAQLFH